MQRTAINQLSSDIALPNRTCIVQCRRTSQNIVAWCPGAESNHRHCDFQSHALPTELPGRLGTAQGAVERAVYSGPRPRCPPGFALRALRRAQPFFAVRHSRTQPSPRVWPPARRCVQNIGESALFRVLDVVVAAGDDVGTGQPTVEVDVAAARRAEWPRLLRRRPAADRAARARFCGLGGLFARFVRHQGDGLLRGADNSHAPERKIYPLQAG
jgi:hypothetical protein